MFAKKEHHENMLEIIETTDNIEEAVEGNDREEEWKLVASGGRG